MAYELISSVQGNFFFYFHSVHNLESNDSMLIEIQYVLQVII